MFIIDSQSKNLKGVFTYQAAVNNASFDKENCKGVITTSAGFFEGREGFCKLRYKLLTVLRDRVAYKHYSIKNNYLFQMQIMLVNKLTLAHNFMIREY